VAVAVSSRADSEARKARRNGQCHPAIDAMPPRQRTKPARMSARARRECRAAKRKTAELQRATKPATMLAKKTIVSSRRRSETAIVAITSRP